MSLLLALFAVLWMSSAPSDAQTPAAPPTGTSQTDPQAEPARHATPHLDVTTFLTEETVALDQRFSIVLDITPKPGIHVYAPGDHDYRVITLRLEPQARVKASPVKYPESVEYLFEPLNERVRVYEQPFRLMQEVALTTSGPEPGDQLPPTVILDGVLEYQACTDTICYPPEEIPLRWSVEVKPGI